MQVKHLNLKMNVMFYTGIILFIFGVVFGAMCILGFSYSEGGLPLSHFLDYPNLYVFALTCMEIRGVLFGLSCYFLLLTGLLTYFYRGYSLFKSLSMSKVRPK